MSEIITIKSGETLSSQWFDSGVAVVVAAGGTLSDTTLSYRAASLTLEAGSTVSGTLTVAAPVTAKGTVNASNADIVLDISKRKPEADLLLNDIAAVAAKSYTVTVNPNQDKGTYRLAGNAANFAGTITVQNSGGVFLGTLSIAAPVLDFDITRYTLARNDAGELTVTISSNISDDSYYAFLYKNNQLVKPLEEGYGLTISGTGEYDHLVVIEDGVAGNIALLDNGVITVYAGAAVVGVDQAARGKLRFDYTAGDTTIISGYNQYGSFLVDGDYLFNVVGENVNLSGELLVENYHTLGVFTSVDGVDITGVFVSSGSAIFKNGTTIFDADISGNKVIFEDGVVVTDTAITGGTFKGGEFTDVTIGGGVLFYGGTFGNSVWNSGTVYKYVALSGDLTVNSTIVKYKYGSGYIDAMGNTITLNYTNRKVTDAAIFDNQSTAAGLFVSEGACFIIDLLVDQSIGTYQILGQQDTASKYSFTIRTAEGVLGTLTETNTSFDCGNYVYTMNSRKELTIDISPNADETFNVLYWLADGTFGHNYDLFGVTVSSTDYKQVIVRENGIVGDIILKSGGDLQVNNGGFAIGIDHKDNAALRFDYTAGDFTLITGYNQYGTFLVQDDLLMNVIGENVNLSGEISVQDYRSTGKFTAIDGVNFTGVLDLGSKEAVFKGGTTGDVVISEAAITGSTVTFYNGVYVADSTVSSAEFRGGSYHNVIVGGGYFYGGTFSDSTWKSGTLVGPVELAGTLTVTGNISASDNSVINANDNTIVLDYTTRTVTSGAIISIKNVSEDVVFQINLLDDQNVGTYTIASNAGSFVDTFNISVAGEVIGTLNNANNFLDYGNYTYTMGWDNETQNITLTIDVSDNAEDKFDVLCYNSENELFYAPEMTTIVIDGSTIARTVVRHGGWLANTRLQNGLLTVRNGATVFGLDQSANGKLRFDYAAGDETIITGYNQYGTFMVSNDEMINVVGENVNVSGAVVVEDYHSVGTFSAGDGVRISGNFTGDNANFNSGVIIDSANVSGKNLIFRDGTDVSDSIITLTGNYNFQRSQFDGNFSNVEIRGGVETYFNGGTYADVTITGSGFVRGQLTLDGKLVIGNKIECVNSYSVNGAIDANGYEVNIDLTNRSPISESMINLNRVYNADLTFTVYANQTIGTYTVGSEAEFFGQGNGEGYWDIDTNKWLYTNAVQGDLDGVVTIRSDLGVELARCTVNGDTEYFGRYNYRVYTDEEHNLKFRIGWNNPGDATFSADGYDNDTLAKATVLDGNAGKLTDLTIHSDTDVDYFKFTLDTVGRASSNISIDFKMWNGDLDIYLYDDKGNQIDYAASVTDNEVLSLHRLAAGDYYLKVVGDEGSVNEYTLNWNLPQKSDLADAYEKGNDKAHSYHLGKLKESVTVEGAISDANDEDWFMFILDKGMSSSDSISITFDDEEADLEFYIYGSNGKDLIGKGIKHRGHKNCVDDDCYHFDKHSFTHNGNTYDIEYTNEELYFKENVISFAGFKHGVYYVRVVSADGGAVNYTLHAEIGSSEVTPDKYENNNSLKKSYKLYSIDGDKTISALSIHEDGDEDYFKFTILEDGSYDDYIAINYEARRGDLDMDILDASGNVVAYARTAENTDSVSLNGFKAGDYYIRVYGYENTVNNYSLNYHFTNSSLIPSDSKEGHEPILINRSQTIEDLSIAKPVLEDETRADIFKIELDYDAWKSSKIILTNYRSDWEGLNYVISTDADGKNVIASGIGSEISLAGLKAGEYYLTLDTPKENQYSEYSVIAQHIPDSTTEIENTWSIFVYVAGDNNLEEYYITELLYMQRAILPENVEVYILMDRSEDYFVGERNWTDTRVGKLRHSPGNAVAVEWMYFEGVDTDTYMNTSNLDQMQEWDTGNISTLEAFLDWGMQTGRADNYALIMKDHGTSLGWNTSDETSGSMLSITEISDLLKQDKYDDLSVVTFAQCLMGSDVVITEMENAVDYTVASEAIGWTPNQLLMYKVLFNSLETNMTPEELANKMVEACNCSGKLDLTLAAFDTSDSYLSTALNEFAGHAKEFTYADWTALCVSFGTAFNYGDDICAFSDLLTILKNAQTFTISDTLADALTKLISDVDEYVIKATQITPAAFGTGLSVFNPVLSSDEMSLYCYSGGGSLDYYASKIGQMAWGDMLYTVGALAEDVSEYITESVGNLTFTDFDYYFGEEGKEIVINLGGFTGNGMTLEGMYVAENARFNIELLQPGLEGDAIRVVADNPDANITITMIQYIPIGFGEVEEQVRRVSKDGILSLEGVDFSSAGVFSDYTFVVTTDKATSYTMSYEANWASGVDNFDFARTGSIDSGKGGNNILDKATKLAAGNYAGLMTYAGDADYYKLSSVYANTISVTIKGSGLTVKEFDADGNEIQSAEEDNGVYSLKIVNGNYLYIEGDADIAADAVNGYTLKISDAESTYLTADGSGSLSLPEIEISGNDSGWTNQGRVEATVSDGATGYYSTDMVEWYKLDNNTFATTVNNRYYFRAVSDSGISNYKSIEFTNIDTVAPVLLEVAFDSTADGMRYMLSGSDDNQLAGFEYHTDGGDWLLSEDGEILINSNAVVDFRAVDAAGNYSDIITRQANIGTVSGDFVASPDASGDITTDFAQSSVVNGKVYSGKNESIAGDVKISAVGGDFNGYIHAGIVADDGDMYQAKGSLILEITDTKFDNDTNSRIYAAGDISNGSFVRENGNVSLTLNNVTTSTLTFVGANVGKESEFSLKGSLEAEINGGNYKTIYVGSSVANGGVSKISGNVSLTVNGGTFGLLGMGSQCKTGGSSIVSGNSLLTINDGYFTNRVYGGAYSQGGTAQIVGNAVLTINGGTFMQNVYAGSFSTLDQNDEDTNSIKTTIGGDTVLTLNASVNKISFAKDIFLYAGSSNYGVVAGNTNVVISGKGENLLFGGSNVISGDSLMYQRYHITYVGGDKNITFDNFSGLLDAQLFAFTRISVINGSCVELSNQEHLADIAEWNIGLVDGETAIACESGKNNFAGDTLALTFDTALDDAVIFDGGTDDLIDNWNKLSAISFNGVAGSWSDVEMAWVDTENRWKVFADSNNDLVISKLA